MNWPTDPFTFVSAAQVAKRLDKPSIHAFYRARPALRKLGFPEPVLGRKWTAGQIDDWIKERLILAQNPAVQAANDQQSVRPGQDHAHKIIARLASGSKSGY